MVTNWVGTNKSHQQDSEAYLLKNNYLIEKYENQNECVDSILSKILAQWLYSSSLELTKNTSKIFVKESQLNK